MKHIHRTSVVAWVSLCVGLLVIVYTYVTMQARLAEQGQPPVVIVSKHDLSSVPVLTPQQEQEAQSTVPQDQLTKRLLHRHVYRILGAVPWTSSQGQLLGAAVMVELGHPSTVQGEWRQITYRCEGSAGVPYISTTYKASRTNVSLLLILIDLKARRIVATNPDYHARIIGQVKGVSHVRLAECQDT